LKRRAKPLAGHAEPGPANKLRASAALDKALHVPPTVGATGQVLRRRLRPHPPAPEQAAVRAVLHSWPMRSVQFFFAYFWFSHRTAAGEANV
jgi:hypothetical protein